MGGWKGRLRNGKGSESGCAGSREHSNSLQKESDTALNAATNGHENLLKHFLYASNPTARIKSQERVSDWLSSSHTSNS